LLRPAPTYQGEETPEGVVHNYLLALEQEDYERAYSYLSPSLEGYPNSADEFTDEVMDNRWQFELDETVSLAVESTRMIGEEARVTVRESTSYDGSLFGGTDYSTTFDMRLQEESGEWKITASESYWSRCWDMDTTGPGC
ncbi:MAG TPA: hypothetical protein VF707_18090, partial [Ardenticatenaceae bacterium]